MRAAILLCSGCILLASPGYSVPLKPGNTDEAAVMQLEAIGDRSPEQWQGRQDYLYDEDHQPGEETVGPAGSARRGCKDEPVRMRRSDGKTVVRRLSRC